ncbi:hypothetical protein DFS34DRAFT_648346 [Phlyctochytrium arcticum]|nr:hypothetical protein DFS34DRAFT_648346 [Phlyctochytrium arcticum]
MVSAMGNGMDHTKVVDAVKAFRFRKAKTNGVIILKVDIENLKVIVDEVIEDADIEALAEELPENSPRYLVLSFELKHKDGRISYPLFGVYYNPEGANTSNRMVYASTRNVLFQQTGISGKIFDLNNSEDLTPEWLTAQLEASKTRP